jgi:hypothetical protein
VNEYDDVVVGCITNYDFQTIKPWVNSLDRCGFVGKKVVLCYNINADVIEELKSRNYTILAFKLDEQGNAVYNGGKPFSIVVERFFHLWAMLSPLKGRFRNLIHTDVKDVIFQKNPSEYIGDFGPRIIAASESIKYKDENWGRENIRQAFGDVVYEAHKENVIVNAGTLSGDFSTLVDFFLNVYMVSCGSKIHNPDQAAVNILLSKLPYTSITHVSPPSEGWACQAGTTNDPNKIEEYLPKLVDKNDAKSYLGSDGLIHNYLGIPFWLVHQWDRVPEWSEFVLGEYGK